MKNIEELNGIEDRLTTKLHAYQPNPQFVNRLRTRLTNYPGIEVESHRNKSKILLVTTALLGVVAFILWLIYYVASFFQNEESN
jgi:hypothetical protein